MCSAEELEQARARLKTEDREAMLLGLRRKAERRAKSGTDRRANKAARAKAARQAAAAGVVAAPAK